jgi:hypothetical protein
VLLGTAFAAAFVTAMYAGGSGKYLLFNWNEGLGKDESTVI